MKPPEDTSHFLKLLADSRLLSSVRIHRLVADFHLTARTAAAETAKILVKAGTLTDFQAERLLAGRARGFFYGPYLVHDVLGAGGMGHVYLAVHEKTGRRVALKALAEKVAHDAGFLLRLRLEARVGQKIRHPRIVATGRLGETAGAYYLPMEYVRGVELQELIEHCQQVHVPYDAGAEQVCDFIRQAAEGLHAAHEAGIIHRDVKPQNLLIDQSGGVKLLDFGLSHVGEDSADDEFSLAMIFGHDRVGTPQYMSPEQAEDSNRVDRRTDVYSLGCTLYHALTGNFPFTASGSSNRQVLSRIIKAHRSEQPPPLEATGRSLPPGLTAVVARMMAKRPEDRYQTARDAAAALSPFALRQPLSIDVDGLVAQRVARVRPLLASSGTGSQVGSGSAQRGPAGSSGRPAV